MEDRRIIVVGGIPSQRTEKLWDFVDCDTIIKAFSVQTGLCYVVDLNNPVSVDFANIRVRECESAHAYAQFREIMRTQHDLVRGGRSKSSSVESPLYEEKKIKYTHGKRRVVEVKSVVKEKSATEAQIKAAENARKFAHTPEAKANRILSVNGRRSEEISKKFDPTLFADDTE